MALKTCTQINAETISYRKKLKTIDFACLISFRESHFHCWQLCTANSYCSYFEDVYRAGTVSSVSPSHFNLLLQRLIYDKMIKWLFEKRNYSIYTQLDVFFYFNFTRHLMGLMKSFVLN